MGKREASPETRLIESYPHEFRAIFTINAKSIFGEASSAYTLHRDWQHFTTP